MSSRAGYTLVVYVLDVSPSMGEMKADPAGSGHKAQRLDWAKEFIARQCEPKSGRKTEAVGVVTFGGRTNNQANKSWMDDNPDDEDPPYAAISSEVAIQTAKPKTLEVLMNLDVGESQGNPLSGLMVALDMIEQHKHTKAWSLEVVLVTDGESEFVQEEFEEAMERFDNLGVKLSVVGVDFQDPGLPIEKDKSRNKRLSEKFWRAFVQHLTDRIKQTSEYDKFLPQLSVLDQELIEARRPHPAAVNGTVSGIHLYIGSAGIDEEQAISIPIKYSKATMKARPPSLSKAWKPAVELQQPTQTAASAQLASQLAESQGDVLGHNPVASDLAAIFSSDVKRFSTYVIKRARAAEDAAGPSAQPSSTQLSSTLRDEDDPDMLPMAGTQATQSAAGETEEVPEEYVQKEDLVKAWRFGSTWVPMEEDTFEPLHTQKGVEVMGFIPRANVRKYQLIGEVRFVWPDTTSPKAQVQFSSFVSALVTTGMAALVRWVIKDDAEPHIGICIPEQSFPGDGKKLDLMYWIKLPFADDDHNFWFPSLTKYKTAAGKEITEHPFIPTPEQCDLMDSLVKGMDLDTVAHKKESNDDSAEEDEDEAMDDEEPDPWFDPARCFNPAIHRTKEAIFHASLTPDLKANPLGPPHPDIVKYFNTPEEIVQKVEKITEQLKEALDIKKIPPRQRKKFVREEMDEDEGYIDIDDLFTRGGTMVETPAPTQAKQEPISPGQPKIESTSSQKPKIEHASQEAHPVRSKPKPGRLVSNEQPLDDFERLVKGSGDVFRKAIQDLGAVVKENVAASFSHSAFPLALRCLEQMRSTALMYEEVETYNACLDDLENTVKGEGFKHPDFWEHVTKAGKTVSRITAEEASEALEEEEYD